MLAVATLMLMSQLEAPSKTAHELLHGICLRHAADGSNPWALAHGITGIGRGYTTRDGENAAQAIVRTALLREVGPDGKEVPGSLHFREYAADGTPIEPHVHLHTKTFLQAGFPLTTRFKTSWGSVTLGDLVASMKLQFPAQALPEAAWKDAAWTLDALAQVLKPGERFRTRLGQDIDFDAVMNDALGALERADAELQDGMSRNLPSVQKNKKGIYAHNCGGLHFVQAVLGWAKHPVVRKRWGKRVDAQVAVFFYRLDSERKQYDAALQQLPEHSLQVLVQMVKFYGHWLETAARLRDELKWRFSEPQQQEVRKARAYLDWATRQLVGTRVLDAMPALKAQKPQVYLDIIGDSCHAAHGLSLWK